jgi:hypothetical protein
VTQSAEVAPAAATPANEQGEAEPDEDKEKKKEDDSGGIFGPFRIGGLVGVGLPGILSFGGIIKITRFLGGGLNVSLIPSLKISFYGDAELSYQEYDIYGRLFPFGGDLFLGAGVGYANIKGSFTNSYDTTMYQAIAPVPNPVTITSEGSVRTMVLIPTIGVLHTFGIGFTIGIDAGAQIPIAPSTTEFKTTVPPEVPQVVKDQVITPNDKQVQDTLNEIARSIVPTLNLRVGWLF